MPTESRAYKIATPGLAEAVAACTPSERHEALLRAIRSFPGWENAKIAAQRDEGWRLVKRKVLARDGALVAADHEQWLRDQLQERGGNAVATRRELAQQGFRLSECELSAVYVVCDRGGARADDFLQLLVRVQNEFVDRELFGEPYYGGPPADLQDLLHDLGPPIEPRARLGPASYHAGPALDVARFVDELDALERERRAAQAKRLVAITDTSTGQSEVKTFGELHPRFNQFASSARRLFEDWAYSSAGRSGARFSGHWVLVRTHDDASLGERHMGLIPGWAFRGKIAEVKARRGGMSDYELAGKLQALDRRVKVPFGWYFFMLHGNRVKDWAGRQMLEAAEAGRIVLPEHDYRVLKNWEASPYGF